jgi:hypothetical protein
LITTPHTSPAILLFPGLGKGLNGLDSAPPAAGDDGGAAEKARDEVGPGAAPEEGGDVAVGTMLVDLANEDELLQMLMIELPSPKSTSPSTVTLSA